MFTAADLFDLTQTEHAAIFDGCNFAWEALKKIEAYLDKCRNRIRPAFSRREHRRARHHR